MDPLERASSLSSLDLGCKSRNYTLLSRAVAHITEAMK